jgi:hypothetical protein
LLVVDDEDPAHRTPRVVLIFQVAPDRWWSLYVYAPVTHRAIHSRRMYGADPQMAS